MLDAKRKYYLDWLRVLAFALLIPFHVGMLYASWFYPLKSPRLVPAVPARRASRRSARCSPTRSPSR